MTDVTASAVPTPMLSYRSWLPRLTSRVLLDLRIWMMGFGLLIGLIFPFAVVPLGVAHDVALRPAFFAATILAGLRGIVNTCGSACFRRPPFQLIRSVPSPPTG